MRWERTEVIGHWPRELSQCHLATGLPRRHERWTEDCFPRGGRPGAGEGAGRLHCRLGTAEASTFYQVTHFFFPLTQHIPLQHFSEDCCLLWPGWGETWSSRWSCSWWRLFVDLKSLFKLWTTGRCSSPHVQVTWHHLQLEQLKTCKSFWYLLLCFLFILLPLLLLLLLIITELSCGHRGANKTWRQEVHPKRRHAHLRQTAWKRTAHY